MKKINKCKTNNIIMKFIYNNNNCRVLCRINNGMIKKL